MNGVQNSLIRSEAAPIKRLAAQLRQSATPAERIVWEMLRGRKLQGLKFRRQHPLHGVIVDFFCHEKRFCIELDGAPHLEPGQKAKDEQRDLQLKALGYKVLRIMNENVIWAPAKFRELILEAMMDA